MKRATVWIVLCDCDVPGSGLPDHRRKEVVTFNNRLDQYRGRIVLDSDLSDRHHRHFGSVV